MKKDKLCGINFHSISKDNLIHELRNDIIKNIKNNHMSITNSEACFIASNDKKHFDYINNAKFSLCDGVGIKIAAKFNKINIKRYYGPDAFWDIIEAGQNYGWTHYLLGGQQGIAEKLTSKINLQFPNAQILGNYSPPFSPKPILPEDIIMEINSLKPDFIWVSLGLPKGEQFIMRYKTRLNCNYITHIGAAFDFHTDNVIRAPKFFQKIGLEWFYRTLFERRLIIRQIRGFKFMFSAILNNKSFF